MKLFQTKHKKDIELSPQEKLLRTDIMELLGGRVSLPSGIQNPPPVVPLDPWRNRGDENEKLPVVMSEQVQEIMQTPPVWMVRWGTTLFFVLLATLLFISIKVKYPDLVSGPLVFSASTFPKSVAAKSSGKLEKLWVKEGQVLEINEPIGLVESAAAYEEILLLESKIDQLLLVVEEESLESLVGFQLPLLFQLGEIQKSYQAFNEQFMRTKAFLKRGAFSQKKQVLNKEIATIEQIDANLNRQLSLLEKELQVAEEQWETQKKLLAKGLVAERDVIQAQSSFLAKKQSLEQAKNGIQNNLLGKTQKTHEQVDLYRQIMEQKNTFIQSLSALKSDLEVWKKSYVLQAPASGKVVFVLPLQENMSVEAGKELFYIQPESNAYFGQMSLGQYNLGKVKTGQEVLVKVNAFPYQEYGLLRGIIEHISELPADSTYTIQVNFPEKLRTDNAFEIPFKNGMTATAEVVTEDLSLFDRFFAEIRRVVK